MKMDKKIVPISTYPIEFNKYLPQPLKQDVIYRSIGLEKHILKRHPDCLKYISLIPNIISNPDYIGINPNEPDTSFELVKILSENIQVGIKLDHNDNYLYVATLHTITTSKLQHGIQNGRLQKFDK